MFYFPGYAHKRQALMFSLEVRGFPHSEIYGSKVARHLPVTYRRQAASFVALSKPRHPPYALRFLLGNLKTTIISYNEL